jgi:hypothetical protein
LYYNKLGNLEEIDKFLDAHGIPELNQQDINNLDDACLGLKQQERVSC